MQNNSTNKQSGQKTLGKINVYQWNAQMNNFLITATISGTREAWLYDIFIGRKWFHVIYIENWANIEFGAHQVPNNFEQPTNHTNETQKKKNDFGMGLSIIPVTEMQQRTKNYAAIIKKYIVNIYMAI